MYLIECCLFGTPVASGRISVFSSEFFGFHGAHISFECEWALKLTD